MNAAEKDRFLLSEMLIRSKESEMKIMAEDIIAHVSARLLAHKENLAEALIKEISFYTKDYKIRRKLHIHFAECLSTINDDLKANWLMRRG